MVQIELDGAVAVVTIDNPPLNVITNDVRAALLETCRTIEADPRIRAVVLTGAGDRAFCAGADLREEEAGERESLEQSLHRDAVVYETLEQLRCPVVAAIVGHCLGAGFELALACDVRVAAEDAKLGCVGVRIGVVANTTRLTRLAGSAIASDLVLSGRTVEGREAERLSVVTQAVPLEVVLDEALSRARVIAERAPLAVERAKRAIREAGSLPRDEAFALELRHFAQLSETEDHRAAVRAFFRREPPVFYGR